MEQITENKYYTKKDAAGILKVTEQSVLKYIKNGELSGVQMGPKKKWHVKGTSILNKMKEWKLL